MLVRLKDVADISQLFPIFDATERSIVVMPALRLALRTITPTKDVLQSKAFMASTGHRQKRLEPEGRRPNNSLSDRLVGNKSHCFITCKYYYNMAQRGIEKRDRKG